MSVSLSEKYETLKQKHEDQQLRFMKLKDHLFTCVVGLQKILVKGKINGSRSMEAEIAFETLTEIGAVPQE